VFIRNRTKNTAFHRYFYAAEAVIPELTSDYASFPYGADFSTSGSYTYVQECLDTEIRYADLRTGTLHIRQDHKTTNAAASNSGYIGDTGVLCYGGWYGGDGGFMSIGVKDAVGLIFDYTGTYSVEEKIIQPLADNPTWQELINTAVGTSSPLSFACAASDRSGWSGGLAFDTFQWGTYEVVDTDYPWSQESHDYVSKYKVDNLEAFYMEYEDTAPRYRTMDVRDEEIFNLYFGGNATATVTYPLPLVITPELPTSSVAHDVDGNCFYSVLADNNLVYNKLITTGDTEDPKLVTKNKGTKPTYYPIAPV
jgi:hypothetical protein